MVGGLGVSVVVIHRNEGYELAETTQPLVRATGNLAAAN